MPSLPDLFTTSIITICVWCGPPALTAYAEPPANPPGFTPAAVNKPHSLTTALSSFQIDLVQSLREQRTLLVWIVDASATVDRQELARRVEALYGDLEASANGQKIALTSAVLGFGEKPRLMTPTPTTAAATIVRSIREIELDRSGKENVFQAVKLAIDHWRDYQKLHQQRMLIVVVTDERGDDLDQLEDTIRTAQRQQARCFVLGHDAPFGREIGHVTFRYEDGATDQLALPQGPESVVEERLQIPYWTAAGQVDPELSSGFGPYGLARLCQATGGRYRLTRRLSDSSISESQAVPYAPDLLPRAEYIASVQADPAKLALIQASRMSGSMKWDFPSTAFAATDSKWLKQEILQAQKRIAVLDYQLNQLAHVLEAAEPHREQLQSRRWQAGFDLALGRVSWMRVRILAYNRSLAQMKIMPRPLQQARSNAWKLVPAAGGPRNGQFRKLARQADTLLERVETEHPGTPWAQSAKLERQQLLDWEWEETAIDLSGRAKPAATEGFQRPIQCAPDLP